MLTSDRAFKVIMVTQMKGGVGKTTSTVLLAKALVSEGKRVLVIDADGQMNATTALLRPFTAARPVDDGKMRNTIERLGLSSLKELMDVLKEVTHIDLLETINLVEVEANLHLMVGNMWTTTELDEYLGFCIKTLHSFPVNRKAPTMPMKLIHRAARDMRADVVLIDTNPNQGLLNGLLWLGSDYYVLPCTFEEFCVAGVEHIAESFARRKDEVDRESKKYLVGSDALPDTPPQCIGAILSHIVHSDDETFYRNKILELISTKHNAKVPGGILWEMSLDPTREPEEALQCVREAVRAKLMPLLQ